MHYENQDEPLDKLTIKRGNLLEFKTTQSAIESNNPGASARLTGSSIVLNNKCIEYQPNALWLMGNRLQHDHRLKILPFGAINTIRQLKLNAKPIKNRLSTRLNLHQSGANRSYLINIKKNGYKSESRIIFTTCGIQSIRYKELQVSQLMSDYSLDFLVLTETCLNSKYDLWKDTTPVNKDQLKLQMADHDEGKGGGLALISKHHYTCQCVHRGAKHHLNMWLGNLELRVAL